MSHDPIGRLLKVTSLGSQKEKLNHVVMTKINPPQITGQTIKAILDQNPPGSIPIPSKVRSITIDVVGKPKRVFKEDNIDLSRQKRSVERHLSKPFGFSERVLSKSNNKRHSSQNRLSSTTYQHPDVWNQSVITESKRKQFSLTKDQTLSTLKNMNKTERDEFIFKSHNQVKVIEEFYEQLRKTMKKRLFVMQYGEEIDQDDNDDDEKELLNRLFIAYVRLRNIQLAQRTDQKFIYLDELKDFCFTIGFSTNKASESQIELFYQQIYNPEVLQDAKIISSKPTLQSLRSLNIIEQLIPGQALVRKTDMISMRAIIYNYKKFIRENYEIHEKFSRIAAKQLLVDLLANIQPWVYKKKNLKCTLKMSQDLEEEFLTEENLCGNAHLLKKINKKIKERNEQIEEKLILSKFILPIIRNQFLQIEILKQQFIKLIVDKAEQITYLEDFLNGLLSYLQADYEIVQENELEREDEENQGNRKLYLEKVAEFIHSNRYRGEQHDMIIKFLVRIKKQFNDPSNNEFIMSNDVLSFCSEYKSRQDSKQSLLNKFIEKAKAFYDKHIGNAEINEQNRKTFDSNTIGTYALKKIQKYDKIIANRAFRINEILNLVQKRTLFGIDSQHYNGPQNENDYFALIETLLNSDKSDFKMDVLFSDNFVHAYLQDYLLLQEKQQSKVKAWNDEIKQALSLYQRESQRLLNVVSAWKPSQSTQSQKQQQQQQQQKQQQIVSELKGSSELKKKSKVYEQQQQQNKQTAQQLNKQFLQNFIESEENEFQEQIGRIESDRSGRNKVQSEKSDRSQRDQQQKGQKSKHTASQIENNIKDRNNNLLNKNSNIILQSSTSQGQNKNNPQNSQYQRNSEKILPPQAQRQQQQQQQEQQAIINQNKNAPNIMQIKQMNTQDNENLSFFEYLDNISGFNDDKNYSFQSNQGQLHQQSIQSSKEGDKKIDNKLTNPAKTRNAITNFKNPSPIDSSHNDLSVLNKTNQDSLDQDSSIKRTHKMYDDLCHVLNSIKDEFDIV